MLKSDAINMLRSFFSKPLQPNKIKFNETIIEYLGIKNHSFGNIKGGSSAWSGECHYFSIQRLGLKRDFIIGYFIGDENESPYLIMGFSDRPSAALQLKLDSFLTEEMQGVQLFHDGRMTAYKGSLKRDVVIEYVKNRYPHLVSNWQIIIGVLPISYDLSLNNMAQIILNLFEYSEARDSLKEKMRSKR